MINIFKIQNGMNIVGQGGKIILFMLPSLIAAIRVHMYVPQIAVLPKGIVYQARGILIVISWADPLGDGDCPSLPSNQVCTRKSLWSSASLYPLLVAS
jgi:hypothetical protein